MIPCLVDAHVHLYDVLDPARLLAAVARHRRAHAATTGLSPRAPAVLMLTQTAAERPAEAVLAGMADWRIAGMGGDGALRLTAADGVADGEDDGAADKTADGAAGPEGDILVVPGRQAVSSEGLEVLALGHPGPLADSGTAADTIRAAGDAGALPVLPWGVGKWTGERGALARTLLLDPPHPALAAGDNAGRLSAGPRPALLAAAEAAGRAVLPGTDPLPLPSEAGKVLRYGFTMELDPDAPVRSLIDGLAAGRRPVPVGRLEGPLRFAVLQGAMQVRKRLGRR